MIIIDKFNLPNTKKRTSIGKYSGFVGLISNLLLSGAKIISGGIAGSTSIIADGLNNLSDAASSVITLIGFKLAEKPADKEHPYGHARFEYLASLTVSVIILFIGLELLKSSFNKIINPAPVEISAVIVFILMISITVKLSMAFFYKNMSKKIQSKALSAASADSRNDAISTSAVLIAAVFEHFTNLKIDGYMGFIVSVFILYSGTSLLKETISPLLGEGANSILKEQITDFVNSYPTVLGCHDLMLHDYGPGKRYATIHVEMDKNTDSIEGHRIIDEIEKNCLKDFQTHLVIHHDPVVTDDFDTNNIKALVLTIIKIRDERLTIHDFRIYNGTESSEINFDMVLPSDLQGEEMKLQQTIEKAINQLSKSKYCVNITFDLEE